MKILSDFDGVLTSLDRESARVHELFEAHIRDRSGLSELEVGQLFQKAALSMEGCPFDYGWKVEDRISAYCNEDAFIRLHSLGSYFDEMATAKNGLYAEALLALQKHDFQNFSALAQTCFVEMTKETASGKHSPLDPH